MSRKPLGNAIPIAINKYINTAYDTILLVAQNLDTIKAVADQVTYLNTYLGESDTPPTQRPNGDPLESGDFYYDNKAVYYYEASDQSWTKVDPEELKAAAQTALDSANTAVQAKDEAVEAADKAKSYTSGTDIGDYTDNPTFNVITDYVVYGRGTAGITLWKVEENVTLPYTINSTTYPHPSDDPNLRAYTATAQLYTYEESTYLTDGQVIVDAQSELTNFVVYLWDAASGERHKLDVVYDYTTNTSNQLVLLDTYPVGSKLTIVFEDIGQNSDTYIKKQEAEQLYGDHTKQANRGAANAHPASSISTTSGDTVEQALSKKATKEELDEDITESQNDIIGGSVFKGSNGETVENGDIVEAGTTHLRIEVGGESKIVAMSPVATGVVSALNSINATIGINSVDFLESKTVVADMVVNIPTDYPDIDAAIKGTYLNTLAKNTTIQINIKSGHKLTSGINVRYGDYSNYIITSDDAVVYLDASNTGVDVSDLLPLYAGIVGEVDGNPLIFGFYAKMPILACVIDMEGSLGTGVQCAESWFMNAENCGVINAGFRGVQIHGFANMYKGIYQGAKGIGLRGQQAARICANNANFDNCVQSKDLTNSAIYGSRSSDIEARYVSAKNSGGIGVISRNARITLDDGDLSGAASYGAFSEKLGDISLVNTNLTGSGNSSLRSTYAGRIHAGQALLSTTGSAKEIDVDQGGMVFVNEATQVDGGKTGYTNILGALRSDMVNKLNSWTGHGFVGYTGNDVTVGDTEYTETADAYIKKFADGTMEAVSVVNIIPTGNIAVGDFSNAIVIPSVSSDFVSVHSVNISCVGRTDAGGGGNRVAVDVYHRPDILIGNEFKVRNTGVQLDGTSNILVVASVQAVVTVKGTWR